MRNFLKLVGIILVASAPFTAIAAEEITVAGEVTARTSSSITVAIKEKKTTATFTVTDETQVRRDRAPVTIDDVRVGELALVVGHKDGAAQPRAVSINLKAQR